MHIKLLEIKWTTHLFFRYIHSPLGCYQNFTTGKAVIKILLMLTMLAIPVVVLYWMAQAPPANMNTNGPVNSISKNCMAEARQFYQNRQFSLASQEFWQYTKGIATPQPEQELEWLEAQLGAVLCGILANDSHWTEKWESCKLQQRGSWQGKFFTYLEYITPVREQYFRQHSSDQTLPAREFLLIQLMLQENHIQFLPQVIKNTRQPALLWDFCLLVSWDWIKQGKFAQAQTVLAVCKQNATPIQAQESDDGIEIIGILQDRIPASLTGSANTALQSPRRLEYSLELHPLQLLRPTSPLFAYEKAIQSHPEHWKNLILADQLFCIGAGAKNHAFFWSQGTKFILALENSAPSDMKPVYHAQLCQLNVAMAWDSINQGDLSEAQAIFEKYLDSKGTPWYQEARLGLAILAYKQGKPLSELLPELEDVEIGWEYWLGGNKISFDRLAERKTWQAPLEKDKIARPCQTALILFDVFCLLGEGYHAKTLLAQIAKIPSPHPISNPILKMEEANIPQDSYSVCRIWEKLD